MRIMFLNDDGYVRKKWMTLIVILTIVIPLVGVVLWSMLFPASFQ